MPDPQSDPQLLMDDPREHAECLQELSLRGTSLIAVFLCVEIERRLDARMTQDALHGFGFHLCLVDQPV
jgi:hypothetical protein